MKFIVRLISLIKFSSVKPKPVAPQPKREFLYNFQQEHLW